MAIIKGGIFDKEGNCGDIDLYPSGRIGRHLYFRKVNGQLQLCAMPGDYKKSMEPDQVNRRDKHRVNGKFCRLINSNPYLHQVWGKSDLKPLKIYNRICQVNFHLCKTIRPSTANIITPPGGFPLQIEKLVYDHGKLEAEIQPIDTEENELKIIYLLYMALYAPVDKQSNNINFIPVKEGVPENQDITFILDPEEQNLAEGYNFQVFYLCAVTINSNGEVVRHSETVAADSGAE